MSATTSTSGGDAKDARTPVLEFRGVNTHYGAVHILKDVDLTIHAGELICLLGGNASGKTTTLKTILGMVKPTSGEVLIDGQRANDWSTARRVAAGVSMVPENRRLFKRMTVRENLDIGAYLRDDDEKEADLERIFAMFPRVKERLNQRAGTLSGGEQQMVAVARALSGDVRVLLLDEPFEGLAPAIVEQLFESFDRLRRDVAIIIVDHHLDLALALSDRTVALERGQVQWTGESRLLRDDLALRRQVLWL